MKKLICFAAAGVLFSGIAFAQNMNSIPNGEPTMTYKVIQMDNPNGGNEHRVTPYRLLDKMVVTVYDPVVCGQKASNPKFKITPKALQLTYDLIPEKEEGKKNCALVSEFVISNVPHADLAVEFAGGRDKFVVSKMRKCPNYKPTGADVYECLSPSE